MCFVSERTVNIIFRFMFGWCRDIHWDLSSWRSLRKCDSEETKDYDKLGAHCCWTVLSILGFYRQPTRGLLRLSIGHQATPSLRGGNQHLKTEIDVVYRYLPMEWMPLKLGRGLQEHRDCACEWWPGCLVGPASIAWVFLTDRRVIVCSDICESHRMCW